jgi:squalene-associated FAD-dependent desaturase
MRAIESRTAVIGAGWAGCAAAVELADAGHQVTLFEASRTLGGRARKVTMNGHLLDNGQHILLGAYTSSLELMQRVGIDVDTVLLRLPLQMRFPQSTGMDLLAADLPAPWHLMIGLLRATGLSLADKLAMARFSSSARKMAWRLACDCSVTALLRRFQQSDRLIQLLWRPLCIAALNTPPDRASAQIFLNVLKDSLGARRIDSDMLIPRVDLSLLLPEPVANYLTRGGHNVMLGNRITGLQLLANRWQLIGNPAQDAVDGFDHVVVATDFSAARTLVDRHIDDAAIPSLDYESITTCYLQYAAEVTLALPFYALLDDASTDQWGQFVFDRSHLDRAQSGLLAVVISASEAALLLDHQVLSTAISRQLAKAFGRPELAQPVWCKIISEKRATFSCTPGLQRANNRLSNQRLVLAGDYTDSTYPSTLESAVRSGIAAARLLIDLPRC